MHMDLNLNSTERKLLFDIRELLIEQNKLLKTLLPNQEDLSALKRSELMARAKELPNKPHGWTKLSNEDMRTLLRGDKIADK